VKANLMLPAFLTGAGMSTSAYAQGSSAASLLAQSGEMAEPTEAEKLAGVAIADAKYPPGNARRYGALGNGKTDDTRALQNSIDAAQAANFSFPVYLPSGDYVINSPLMIRGNAPKSVVLIGDGGAFGIRNTKITVGSSWSGDCMIQSDKVRKNGWTISDIWFDAGGKAKCVLDLQEFNYMTIRGCRIASATGTIDRDGFGAVTMKNGWVTRIENCVMAACGDGMYCGNNTNNLNIWGCSFVTNRGIGLRIRGCQAVDISGSVFEDNEHAAILFDGGRGIWISGNYFEMNGRTGYRYTKGENRTIRADIITNGWVSPEIKANDPCRGMGVYGNFFLPPKEGDFDASIYILAVDGFSESANEVHWPYPVPAAFIKTKNNQRIYKAANLTLGNSYVEGLRKKGGADRYFDIEALNDERNNTYDDQSIRSIYVHPQHAPRFNAHEDLGFDHDNYEVLEKQGGTLKVSKSTLLRMGRPVYFADSATRSASDVLGGRVAEAAYEEFWDGQLWLACFEVQSVSGSPVFDIQIRIGNQVFRSGGRLSRQGQFVLRTVAFKPVAGSDFSFGISMSGAGASERAALSRPIICPLGVLNELQGPYGG
jgi:hypothetical protein